MSGSADPGPDLANLQETFSQQQAKIAALKELVKNAEQTKSTATQERVKIAQRLTSMKVKARSRQSVERTFEPEDIETADLSSEGREDLNVSSTSSFSRQQSVPSTPVMRAKSETPGSEKIQLLRQQMEQNRQKMAERVHSNRGIEEMVTQLKAKFDITQMSLEKSSELGKSIGDLSLISGKGGLARSTQDLSSYTPSSAFNLDKERIRNLQRKIIDLEHRLKEKESSESETEQSKRIKDLENKILDLEENLKEKEMVIDARTQAVSLMTENLSLKGKNTVEMLEETKQEMFKMQTNFIQTENELKSDIEILKIEIDDKSSNIENLREKIEILESNRYDLTMRNSELEGKLNDVQEYSTKLSELNKLNESLQYRITEMESQKFDIITDDEVRETNDGRIRELESEIEELKKTAVMSDSEILEKYESLKLAYDRVEKENGDMKEKMIACEESLAEKTIEYKVLQANFSVLEEKLKQSTPKSLFSKSTDEDAEAEITKLKGQLDDANKSAIKTKLKMKQLQKQIDNLKKSSNLHTDVIRLSEENQSLQQKIVELEEEKGSLQLKLVNEDSVAEPVVETDLENRIKVLEHTCQNQNSAIQLLEEQKIDMTQNLVDTKSELTSLKDHMKEIDQQETTRVNYGEIEFDEKLENYRREIGELQRANQELKEEFDELFKEKNRYFADNMELIDKLEKLSVEKKGSSSESIEIVANLTQQEKAEIEEYEKLREKSKSVEEKSKLSHELDEEESHDLNDSLIKLREESSELLEKVNLFSAERSEVLEKMEGLKTENASLKLSIDRLESENKELMSKSTSEINDETINSATKSLDNEIESCRRLKDQKAKKMMKKLINESSKVSELLKSTIAGKLQEETAEMKKKSESGERSNEELEQLRRELSEVIAREIEARQKIEELSINAARLEEMEKMNHEQKNRITELNAENTRLTNEANDYEVKLQLQLIDYFTGPEKEMTENIEETEALSMTVQTAEAVDNLRPMLDNQEQELHYKQETIDALNSQIIELYKSMEDNTNQLVIQQDELQANLDLKSNEIVQINKQLDNSKASIAKLEKDLREKIKQIEALESKRVDDNKVRELEEKNKEQLEKLKKFAANLKRKNAQCAELEEKLSKIENERPETNVELNQLKNERDLLSMKLIEKDRSIEQLQQMAVRLEEEMNVMRIELSKTNVTLQKSEETQQTISSLNEELSRQKKEFEKQERALDLLESEVESLKRNLSTKESETIKMSEVFAEKEKKFTEVEEDLKKSNIKIEKCKAIIKEKNKEIQRLNTQSDELKIEIEKVNEKIIEKSAGDGGDDKTVERLNAKIQENSLYIETIETENADLKTKLDSLREELSFIEEERYRLKQENDSLDNELYERSEDWRRNEEDLEDEIDHLKVVEKRIKNDLKTMENEKNTIVGQLEAAKQNHDELSKKVTQLQNHITFLESDKQFELEKSNQQLTEEVGKLEIEIKRLHTDFEKKVYEKKCEVDEIESSYSETVQSIQNGKKEIEEDLEKLRDENAALKDEIVQLKDSIHNFEQSKSDLERELTWKRLENQNLSQEHVELQELQMQIVHDQTELENLRQLNQTITTNHEIEVNNLRKQLADLDSMNLQVGQNQTDDQVMVQHENAKLRELLVEKEREIESIKQDVENTKRELVRQQSQPEVDNVIAFAEEHVRNLQSTPGIDKQHRIDELRAELEQIQTYTLDLEARFKSAHVIREESLRQLAEKTKHFDDLKEINKNNEIKIAELQSKMNQSEPPPPVIDVTTTSVVPSFDGSAFFGSIPEVTPFEETISVRQLGSLESMSIPSDTFIDESQVESLRRECDKLRVRNIEAQLKFDSELQQIMMERENLMHSLTELRSANEENLKRISELEGRLHEQESNVRVKRDIDDVDRSQTLESASRFFGDSPNLFDTPQVDDVFRNKTPIVEELIVPKKMYVCGPEEQVDQPMDEKLKNQPSASMEILFDDQSWGWETEPQSLDNFAIVKEAPIVQMVATESAVHPNVQNNYEKLLAENENLVQNIDVLKLQLDTIQSKNNSLQLLSIDNQNLLRNMDELKSQLEAIQVENRSLHESLDEIKSTWESSRDENTRLQSNVIEMRERINDMTAEGDALNRTIVMLRNEIDELKCIVEMDKCHKTALEMEKNDVMKLCGELREQLEQKNVVEEEKPKDITSFFQSTSNEPSPFDTGLIGVQSENAEEQWGWGSNEAVLEEQHQATSALATISLQVPQAVQSQVEIQEYQDRIQVLELEKSRLEEEVTALKVKSGKLIKKFKEYKNDVEGRAFKKSPSVESSDLDAAIQDELNKQVKSLESKLKEARTDYEKISLEKENLVKRVDVLTSANDRMTEMKERQDNEVEMCHYKIKELQGKLERLEEWGDENYNKDSPIKVPHSTHVAEVQNIEELESKITQLSDEVRDLRVDNDELQALLDEEKNNNRINDSKLSQIQLHVDQLKSEIETLTEDLHKSKSTLYEKSNEINTLTNEIERMKTASLFQSLETPTPVVPNPFNTSSSDNQQRIDELENEIQNLHGQLSYKNSETVALNDKVDRLIREDQTQSLVQEILMKNHEINLLKGTVQELTRDKDELEHNVSVQLTQEEIVTLRQEIDGKNATISSLEAEKIDMESELKVLNDQVIASLALEDKMKSVILELDVKNIEIAELRNTLQQGVKVGQEESARQPQDQTTDQKLYDLEAKWKQYVMEREMQYNQVIDSLHAEIAQLKIQQTQTQSAESESDSEKRDGSSSQQPSSDEFTKMREALETQEMEIVTLKEQLAIRSAEYARLASQVDPFGQNTSSSITLFKDKPSAKTEENTDVIPRAELDLALYMLHQRDMRCEELTFELVHLLEERDTLQLKLSNSIRQTEDIRRRAGDDSETGDPNLNTAEIKDSTSTETEMPSTETQALRSKLNQIQGSHSRDKTLQEDRESRQRQFTQLQKDISNIPSEAVAQLVGTDYTMSRTTQSPSSVLFNWLMGKSTPKAPPQS